ncbi:MAG: glutamate--cysteine ligase [Deltaproteobacteria bacterium]|nr:glutamate--cysteine ligase [Deltaproteobacteria bacterium]
MSGQLDTAPTPVESLADLIAFLASGEKPRERFRVGTEHEKIGFTAGGKPVPYEGANGIAALLEAIAQADGWERGFDNGKLIALKKNGASITLEPGGQFELSGAPLRTIFETDREIRAHLELVKRLSAPLGITWTSLAHHPVHDLSEIPRMPKTRYGLMRTYLPTRGELALHMMHLTATVQANMDFASEADMVRKLRAAMAVTPIVSAMFANSSLYLGKPSGFITRREHIWRHTDPDRCGLLPFVFEDGFGYERYARWALDVPMFFIVRDGVSLPAHTSTFRQFLARGFEGHRPTAADWDLHLTTLFHEVRLKRIIEVRGADCVPFLSALPALWKGLLYDDTALDAAFDLAKDWSFAEREAALEDVARRGLAASAAGQPVLPLARELAAIASEGLRRIGHGDGPHPDERVLLDPLHAQLAKGRSLGEELVDAWEGDLHRDLNKLIAATRF